MAADRLILQTLRDGVARVGEKASRRLGHLATEARLTERVTTLTGLPARLREQRLAAMARAERVGREKALSVATRLHTLASRLESVARPATAAEAPAEQAAAELH